MQVYFRHRGGLSMILLDYKINGNAIVLSKKDLEDNLARLADKMEMHRNNNEFEMWMVTAGEREAVISILKLFDYEKV